VVTQSRRRWRCRARKRRDQSVESRRTRDTIARQDSQQRMLAESSNTCRQQSGEASPKTAREHTTGETRLQGCMEGVFCRRGLAFDVPDLNRTSPNGQYHSHVCAIRLQHTRQASSAQLAETLAYKVHVHSHRAIPPDTAQHHQTCPSVMPASPFVEAWWPWPQSWKRRSYGSSTDPVRAAGERTCDDGFCKNADVHEIRGM
jgi:hypothetical protein